MIVDLAISCRDEDIEHVRIQRKFWASYEQQTDSKDVRKLCQKYVKATTWVLEYMTGRRGGKWDADPITKTASVPIELAPYIQTVFCFAYAPERIHFADIYAETE